LSIGEAKDIQGKIFRDDEGVIGIKTFENMGANGKKFKFCIDLGDEQKTNPKTGGRLFGADTGGSIDFSCIFLPWK
jgi:hypothetical protein